MDKSEIQKAVKSLLDINPALRKFVFRPIFDTLNMKINHKQFNILSHLEETSPLSMSALADCIASSNQQLTALVSQLVEMGYVERREDEKNRRVMLVSITPQGSEYLEENKKKILELFTPYFEKFNSEELSEISRCSQTIIAILNKE